MGFTPLPPPAEPSLPPWQALSFIPFIYLQAILLHPAISSAKWSRRGRLALMIPAVMLAAVAPFWWRIQPLQVSAGANFRWGIFGPWAVLRALEWGFVKDRSLYTWIGFDKAEVVDSADLASAPASNGHSTQVADLNKPTAQKRSLPTPPDSPVLGPTTAAVGGKDIGTSGPAQKVKREHTRFQAANATPLTIALDALHLLTSFRGIGYAFGPPLHNLAPTPPNRRGPFLRRAVYRFLRSHIISTLCTLIIIERETGVPEILHRYLLPFASTKQVQPIASVAAYIAVGVSMHAQMLIGFEGSSVLFVLLDYVPLPEAIKPVWDSREWPDLFYKPFRPETVTIFWSRHWHALFRKPFTTVGYEPTTKVVSKVAGKRVGRATGAMVVFALSGLMHEIALWSSRWGVESLVLPTNLTFLERWGNMLFFISQGLAVILESLYPLLFSSSSSSPSSRNKKFPRHGTFALLWTYGWVVGLGCFLAGRSWIALGLTKGLPEVRNWGWGRFVVPNLALAPPPLFTV